MTKPLLVLKTGSTLPSVAERRGDFEDWIARGLGLAHPPRIAAVASGDALPEPHEFAGVVVTGSSAMVSEREGWSERAARWLPAVIDAGVPVLGICYGHQLLAHGLGGVVGPNPNGREIGTVELSLAAAARDDRLLGGGPAHAAVHMTHVESVLALPREAVLLATSDADPHAAFRIGELAWGVQFHPEFDADVMRGYLDARREVLREEGLDAESRLAAVTDSPFGGRVLRRFAAIVRGAVSAAV